ncbi:MAG: signal peptidase II [Pseudomonadota bacterium]
MNLKRGLYSLVLVLVAIDQLSKRWVEANLPYQEPVNILPLFSLFRTHNTGIAFSMMKWLGSTGLVLLTGVIIIFMVWLWQRVPRDQQLTLVGFAFVIGGALGNLVDRVMLGHVVDFFLFHTDNWAFAVFNPADAFITMGAIAIIVDELFAMRRKAKSKPS